MNCCDYNCTQGRDCPIRVAKVGQRIPGPEPLPPSVWRYWVRRIAYWVLMGIFGLLWLAFLTACVVYAN
jgi:hypothetical protein